MQYQVVLRGGCRSEQVRRVIDCGEQGDDDMMHGGCATAWRICELDPRSYMMEVAYLGGLRDS
jgi:hypothetical protein